MKKCTECRVYAELSDYEWLCPTCGIIIEEDLFVGSTFDRNGEKVRHRDRTLGSFIGNGNGVSRLKRTERSTDSPHEKAIQNGLFYCNMVCSEFDLSPEARSEIQYQYARLKNKSFFTTRMKVEIRAAAVAYIVMRQFSYNYTLREIASRLEIPRKDISKIARQLAREFNMGYIFTQNNLYSMIEKFALKLDKPRDFMDDVLKVHEYMLGVEYAPPTLFHIGAMFYLVDKIRTDSNLTQRKIADAMDISPQSIGKQYRYLKRELNIEEIIGITIEEIIEGIR